MQASFKVELKVLAWQKREKPEYPLKKANNNYATYYMLNFTLLAFKQKIYSFLQLSRTE